MAIRTILQYPDKRLRIIAEKVTVFDKELAALVEDMAETMYAAPGVGLAAPQVGVSLRLYVIDTAAENEPSALRAFINPEIVEKAGTIDYEEGCLSFPGVHETIERAERVRVRAQHPNGAPFELEAEGLLAVAIQHELDHLDGVLLVDHLGPLKKRLVHRKMLKRAEASTVT